jgi:NadR type nicotinamide-nucleotide adenylyltransferase
VESAAKVSIIGADCTGKTALAKSLADHYGTIWVPEFAREFLLANGGKCNVSDMITISRSQVMAEALALPKANRILFSDGSPLASCVWSMRYFGEITPDLIELAHSHTYDLYLLADTDLPWEGDGLRNSQHLRSWLHQEFVSRLRCSGCRFSVVHGTGEHRLESAIEAVDALLVSSPPAERSR